MKLGLLITLLPLLWGYDTNINKKEGNPEDSLDFINKPSYAHRTFGQLLFHAMGLKWSAPKAYDDDPIFPITTQDGKVLAEKDCMAIDFLNKQEITQLALLISMEFTKLFNNGLYTNLDPTSICVYYKDTVNIDFIIFSPMGAQSLVIHHQGRVMYRNSVFSGSYIHFMEHLKEFFFPTLKSFPLPGRYFHSHKTLFSNSSAEFVPSNITSVASKGRDLIHPGVVSYQLLRSRPSISLKKQYEKEILSGLRWIGMTRSHPLISTPLSKKASSNNNVIPIQEENSHLEEDSSSLLSPTARSSSLSFSSLTSFQSLSDVNLAEDTYINLKEPLLRDEAASVFSSVSLSLNQICSQIDSRFWNSFIVALCSVDMLPPSLSGGERRVVSWVHSILGKATRSDLAMDSNIIPWVKVYLPHYIARVFSKTIRSQETPLDTADLIKQRYLIARFLSITLHYIKFYEKYISSPSKKFFSLEKMSHFSPSRILPTATSGGCGVRAIFQNCFSFPSESGHPVARFYKHFSPLLENWRGMNHMEDNYLFSGQEKFENAWKATRTDPLELDGMRMAIARVYRVLARKHNIMTALTSIHLHNSARFSCSLRSLVDGTEMRHLFGDEMWPVYYLWVDATWNAPASIKVTDSRAGLCHYYDEFILKRGSGKELPRRFHTFSRVIEKDLCPDIVTEYGRANRQWRVATTAGEDTVDFDSQETNEMENNETQSSESNGEGEAEERIEEMRRRHNVRRGAINEDRTNEEEYKEDRLMTSQRKKANELFNSVLRLHDALVEFSVHYDIVKNGEIPSFLRDLKEQLGDLECPSLEEVNPSNAIAVFSLESLYKEWRIVEALKDHNSTVFLRVMLDLDTFLQELI